MGYEDFRPTSEATISKEGRSARRSIHIYAADEGAALAHSDAPKYGDAITVAGVTLYCNSVTANEVPEGVNASGELLFEVTAVYQTLDKAPVTGKARWFCSGQNEQAKVFAVDEPNLQDHYYDLTLGGYDGQAIGLVEDGAEGCDVDDPYEILRIERWMAPADTMAYLEVLRGLRNMVNNGDFAGPWGTYAAGEARFRTFDVQHVHGELDQVTLEFYVRKEVSFDVSMKGAGSTGQTVVEVVKPGHTYYWQRTTKQLLDGDDTKTKIDIRDAHVAHVYRSGDFSGLGITWEMFDMVEPS